ncbi:hypothetical protein FTUN_5934 [Frigoriglobus tundricola]|uniref:Uncharacterized protein n=1 Tax=Frigoriglobus tundricola TaxID=2774151 RepID=A0A6M5YY49_9BACT|nr:hypothetical protein FTUN_5934 [Frigoriglobus tundricola]
MATSLDRLPTGERRTGRKRAFIEARCRRTPLVAAAERGTP